MRIMFEDSILLQGDSNDIFPHNCGRTGAEAGQADRKIEIGITEGDMGWTWDPDGRVASPASE